MGKGKVMGSFVKSTLFSAAVGALCASTALAAPSVRNFGYTVPYQSAGAKLVLSDDIRLSGDIRQVMLRFVNPQRNKGERLLVSNVAPGLSSRVEDNVLIISGQGSAADYEKVLHTLSYMSDTAPENFGEQIIEIAVLDSAEATVMSKRIIADPNGTYVMTRAEESEPRIFPLPPEMVAAAGAPAAPAVDMPEPLPEDTFTQEDTETFDAPDILPSEVIEPAGDYRNAAAPSGRPSGPIISAMVAAYHTNEQLMSKRSDLKITNELASQAFSFWLPTIGLNAQKGRGVTDRPDVRHDGVVERYGADFNMPLFRGGRTVARMNREDQRIFAERYDLLNTEQETLLEAVTAFMSVWRDRNLLDLYRQNENVLKTNLEDTQARFQLGEVTQTDVFQSETRFTRAISERLRIERDLKNSEARYARVVGDTVPVTYNYDAPETLHYFDVEELREDALSASALQYHPLIKTAEHDLLSAQEDIDLKKGQLLPTVSLNASVQREDGTYLGANADDQTNRSVLFNFDVPLYQSGSEYSEVRQAKLTVEKLRYDLQERRQAVQEDVETAVKALNVALRSIENNSRQAAAAEKALQSVIYESQLGTRTTLDALDAQQEFLEAKILLVRSQYEEAAGAYRLLQSLGRLNSLSMQLPVDYFDPEDHYKKVKRKVIGF